MSIRIQIYDRKDPRLGRFVSHDSRSRNFPVMAPIPIKPKTIFWSDKAQILDQKDVGACVGFTGADILNTDVFKPIRKQFHKGEYYGNSDGLGFYHAATAADRIKGVYPPDDTGSSGLGLAKALKKGGLIDRYTHAFTYAQLLAAIETQPVAVGTLWTNDMYNYNSDGVISVGPLIDNNIVGGHEYSFRGHDAARGLWLARNHWGDTWNPVNKKDPVRKSGEFWITDADVKTLLQNDGDVTVLHGVGLP